MKTTMCLPFLYAKIKLEVKYYEKGANEARMDTTTKSRDRT